MYMSHKIGLLTFFITATRYKQAIGNDVILYWNTSGGKQEKFTWTFNSKEVTNEQSFKFQLIEAKIGIYCCHVQYDDGDTLTSSCNVEEVTPVSFDQKAILRDLTGLIQCNFCRR